tara:strand:+ start:158 stop:400 length:243 start_codon:yes stop_codon:yes gene_type:complete
MGLSEAINIFEQRKVKMSQILQTNNFSMEKRHKLVGAMEEIDVFITTLRSLQVENAEQFSLIPEQESNVFEKLISRFKGD